MAAEKSTAECRIFRSSIWEERRAGKSFAAGRVDAEMPMGAFVALERDHVLEAGASRDSYRGVGLARVLVADVLDEEQDEDVVLVLLASMPPRNSSQLDQSEE